MRVSEHSLALKQIAPKTLYRMLVQAVFGHEFRKTLLYCITIRTFSVASFV
jgi:hypothetical protein